MYLKVIGFTLLFIWSSAAAQPILNVTFDLTGQREAPIIIHEEWEYSFDNFLVLSDVRFYVKKPVNISFSHTAKSGNSSIWDYQLWIDTDDDGIIEKKLVQQRSFIEGNKEGDKWIYEFPPFTIGPNTTYATLRYRITDPGVFSAIGPNFLGQNGSGWFPFDRYKLGFKLKPTETSMIYSAKVTLPKTLGLEYNETAIRGIVMQSKALIAERYNASSVISREVIKILTAYAEEHRPPLEHIEGDKRTIVLPPVFMPSRYETPPKNYNRDIAIDIIVKRTQIDISYFVLFFVVLLAMALFYLRDGKQSTDLLRDGVGVWALQEGIYQLLPPERPPHVTLFDLTILIPVLGFFVLFLMKNCSGRNAKKQKSNPQSREQSNPLRNPLSFKRLKYLFKCAPKDAEGRVPQSPRTHPHHVLEITAHHQSLAKFLYIKRMLKVIYGEKFDVVVRLRNVRDVRFPGGSITISILWPNSQTVLFNRHIPPLNPGEPTSLDPYTTDAASEGFALFFVYEARPYDGASLDFVNESGDPRGQIGKGGAFYSFPAYEWSELYTKWGFYATSGGFLILILEKVFSNFR